MIDLSLKSALQGREIMFSRNTLIGSLIVATAGTLAIGSAAQAGHWAPRRGALPGDLDQE
ncbi:hypothetical protein [Paraburkholderia atlantica]|uniref:hypothetical protein n=1 Tax=Paraburkholderia atlantica TaxID=2654982 RepID=UPI0016194213|nr:hypothetical protein [Paraburkholderia atlantica]MBB5503866.1 hypothetical protein [Paraburkholderia atlantica]